MGSLKLPAHELRLRINPLGVPEEASHPPVLQGGLKTACDGLSCKLKVQLKLLRSRPHVALVPFILFALLVGFGCFGVWRASISYTNSSQDQAVVVSQSAAKILQYYLSVAAAPLQQLTALILQDPFYPRVIANAEVAWPALWQAAPDGADSISMVPYGIVASMYPETLASKFWINQDTLKLQDGPAAAHRILNFYPTPTSGPIVYINAANALQPATVTFFSSVHLKVNSSSETWGFPVNRAPYNTSWCQVHPEQCYNAERGEKWWGLVSVSAPLANFHMMQQATAHVQASGYQIQVKIPAVPGQRGAGMLNFLSDVNPPDDAAMDVLPVGDDEWQVYVWKQWAPAWLRGMYAVVVVGAFVVCVLLLAILASWEEHRVLLHSLLPKQTIQRMRQEADWTSMAKQEEMIETVSLETPAKNMLQVIAAVLHGETPTLQMLVSVKDALQRSADVYKPTVEYLKGRMKESEFVDAEVRQALVAQLVGSEQSDPDVRLTDTLFVPREPLSDGGFTPTASEAGTASDSAVVPARLATPFADEGHPATYACIKQVEMNLSGALDFSQDVVQILKQMMALPPTPSTGLGSNAIRGARAGRPTTQQLGTLLPASVPPSIPLPLEIVLATANDWQFDAYALEDATNGRPLSVLGYYLLHQSGLIQWAHMDCGKLVRFLQQIEDMYPDNPYHNRRHAANVLQAFHVIMHRGGLAPGFVDQLTMLGCYLAAIIHDVGHKGCNNDYLVNTHDDLAITYNDKSPLESFHVAAAFRLLKLPEFNCLATGKSGSASGLSKANWIKLRKLVIELVLATDMKAHFATMGQFDALMRTEAVLQSKSSLDDERLSPRVGTTIQALHTNPTAELAAVYPTSDTDKLLTLQIALKCADVGHLTSPLSSHLRWVTGLEQEFFLQGDAERAAGLAVSPLCDRNKEGVTKSQVGFFDFVVIPMFKSFCGRFRASRPMWHQLMDNYRHWCAIAAKPGDVPRSGPTSASSMKP